MRESEPSVSGTPGRVTDESRAEYKGDALGMPRVGARSARGGARSERRADAASDGVSLASSLDDQLEAVYANAPFGLCVLDRELRFLRINERLAEMNGPSVAAHIGRTIREVLPELANIAEPQLRRVLQTGEPAFGVEVTGVTPAQPGVVRTWLEHWIPLRDARGTIVGINVVAEEVTERRRIELRLRESEAQFRALVEQSPMATVVWDARGAIVLVNRAFEVMWDITREALGADYRVTNDPQLARLGLLPDIERALAGARVTLPPVRYDPSESRLPGRALYVEPSFSPIRDDGGGVQRIVGVFRDVTARVEGDIDRSFLFDLGSKLQTLDSPGAISAMATEEIGRYLGASRCMWASVDLEGETIGVQHEWRASGRPLEGKLGLQRWTPSRRQDDGPGIPTIFSDTLTDERSAAMHGELFAPIDVRAFIRVPMVSQGVWVASLSVAHRQPHEWTPREIAFVRSAAERVWPAFEAAQQATRAEAERLTAVVARRRTERLQRVTALLTSAATRHDVCEILAREGSTAVGADGGAVALAPRGGGAFEWTACFGMPLRDRDAWLELLLAALPPTHEAEAGAAIWLESAAELRARFPALRVGWGDAATGAWGIVPFPLPNNAEQPSVRGAIALRYAAGEVAGDDRRMAATIAALGASALERVRLFEAEREARIRTERVQRLTAAMSRALTETEVGEIFVAEGSEVLGAKAGAIALLSDDGGALELRASTGLSASEARTLRRVNAESDDLLAITVREGRTLSLGPEGRERAAPWFSGEASAGVLASAAGAVVMVPLVARGRPLGACCFLFDALPDWSASANDLIAALASQCSQALDRAALYEGERHARTAAELASQAKSQFLAAMSHELRTPLNAIQGYVQLIEMEVHGPINDAQRAALARVQRNQRHLFTLVSDLLNLSRIESGRMEYHLVDLRLTDVVQEILEMVEPQRKAKELQFSVSLPEDVTVRADRERLAQILINLFDNAIKFTARGGRVSVDCVRRSKQSALVFLRVSDTGRGIGSDKLKTIFEPFVQLDPRAVRKDEGVGLGLAISRELARGMRGDLRARSTTGEGSTFTLALPVADLAVEQPLA